MKISRLAIPAVTLFAALMLHACSAASTLAQLNIGGLKGVEFGETEQEVQDLLKSHNLTSKPPDPRYAIFGCDGLIADYENVHFAPTFFFKRGKLAIIRGNISDPSPMRIAQLEHLLDSKFGRPETKDWAKMWFDGGVKVTLASVGKNQGMEFNCIAFETPDH